MAGRFFINPIFFDRHVAAPDALDTLGLVGSLIQPSEAAPAVNSEVGRFIAPRRRRERRLILLNDLEIAGMLEPGCHEFAASYGHALASHSVADFEVVVSLRALINTEGELLRLRVHPPRSITMYPGKSLPVGRKIASFGRAAALRR
jgi:hypothetical protein